MEVPVGRNLRDLQVNLNNQTRSPVIHPVRVGLEARPDRALPANYQESMLPTFLPRHRRRRTPRVTYHRTLTNRRRRGTRGSSRTLRSRRQVVPHDRPRIPQMRPLPVTGSRRRFREGRTGRRNLRSSLVTPPSTRRVSTRVILLVQLIVPDLRRPRSSERIWVGQRQSRDHSLY